MHSDTKRSFKSYQKAYFDQLETKAGKLSSRPIPNGVMYCIAPSLHNIQAGKGLPCDAPDASISQLQASTAYGKLLHNLQASGGRRRLIVPSTGAHDVVPPLARQTRMDMTCSHRKGMCFPTQLNCDTVPSARMPNHPSSPSLGLQ